MGCIFCDKKLELVNGNKFQPYGGGEVIFEFTYGSRKFDEAFGITAFHGIVCDECAEKYVNKMTKD